MMGVALGLFFNIRFSLHPRNYGISLCFAALGMAIALRHIAYNACSEKPPSPYIFGPYHLYTWSFLVFFASVIGISVLLMFYSKQEEPPVSHRLSLIVFFSLFATVFLGALSVFQRQGFSL